MTKSSERWICLHRGLPARGAVGLLVVLASGCLRPSYVPTRPVSARSGDVTMDLRQLSTGGGGGFTFDARAGQSHVIRRGWMTVATRAPCSGGAEVKEVRIDGQAAFPATVPPGAHQLRVGFESLGELSLDVVVDLELDDGACVRAPAVSQSVPFTSHNRFMAAVSTSIDGGPDLFGLRATTTLQLGLGAWLGPVLASAEAGLAVSICQVEVCGKESSGNLRSSVGWSLAGNVRYKLGTFHTNQLAWVPFLGARYTYAPVDLPAMDGARRFAVHGVAAVVGLGAPHAIKGPFLNRERAFFTELAIPIGVLVSPDVPNQRIAFTVGFSGRIALGL